MLKIKLSTTSFFPVIYHARCCYHSRMAGGDQLLQMMEECVCESGDELHWQNDQMLCWGAHQQMFQRYFFLTYWHYSRAKKGFFLLHFLTTLCAIYTGTLKCVEKQANAATASEVIVHLLCHYTSHIICIQRWVFPFFFRRYIYRQELQVEK